MTSLLVDPTEIAMACRPPALAGLSKYKTPLGKDLEARKGDHACNHAFLAIGKIFSDHHGAINTHVEEIATLRQTLFRIEQDVVVANERLELLQKAGDKRIKDIERLEIDRARSAEER